MVSNTSLSIWVYAKPDIDMEKTMLEKMTAGYKRSPHSELFTK